MSLLTQVFIVVLAILLIVVFIAYILRRDSAVDRGDVPLVVKVPGSKYTLTPSPWFWAKVRRNKRASGAVVVAFVLLVWWWLT